MINNPYMNYSPQASIDRINAQMNELDKLKNQLQQSMQQPVPTNLTQNFQIAPTNNSFIRYANSIDDVQKEMITGDTPFFSKDLSVVWIKSTKGDIKAYELNEIIPKDAKDMQIEFLQSQIEELKGMIKNDRNVTNVDSEQNSTDTATDDSSNGTTTKKSKSTSIQKV